MGLMVAVGAAEVITAVTVLESVAAVGAVLSVVGTVTKNKTLSMIGMGLGVVGGVGALAAGALGGASALVGGADAAAEAGGDTLAVSAAGSEAASGGIEAGTWADGMAGAATEATSGAAGTVAPDVVGALGANTTSAAANPVAETITLANETTGVAPAAVNPANAVVPGTTGGTNTTGLLNADITPGTPVPPQPPANLGAVDPTTGNVITSGLDASGKTISLPGSSGASGMFDKIVNYAGDHPVVALGALQAGGTLLSGMTSSLTPAQVTALNAQAAANDAAAAMAKQQATNLAMPKSVASSVPVTGTPAQLVPQAAPTGLINQPVTGRPA